MKKIYLIIEREFLSRVKKKSFLITTLLVPILFAGLMVGSVYIQTIKDTEEKTIAVIDRSGLAGTALQDTPDTKFVFLPTGLSLDSLKQNFKEQGLYAVVMIGSVENNSPVNVDMYAFKQPNLDAQQYIKRNLEKEIEQKKLESYDIKGLDSIMAAVRTNLQVKTFIWDEKGEEKVSDSTIYMIIAYILSFMIYMFIFMFGSMVMRGVIEEKANRIIEVIISSVKPFQLMMGKIIGVASVGLLQFILWVILTFGAAMAIGGSMSAGNASAIVANNNPEAQEIVQELAAQSDGPELLAIIGNINFAPIVITFLLFFLFGYLLYASMFAAIGSAVENEADTQQLVMPVTIPLVIGMLIMLHTFQYPDSTLSFWGSIIPFTSPMVMMARIPFGVPFWQLALSLSLLFLTFVAFAWIAGKIYRVGILMYGKKASLKEMWKWLKYKN